MQSGKKSYKIVHVKKSNGCVTKHNHNSRFISKTPSGAAKKALTALCSQKSIKGVCTFYITLQETTRGSNGKQFTYICKRSKLAKPLEIKNKSGKVLYKVEYQTSCKSHKGSVTVAAGTKCKQSVGIMSKQSKLKRRQKKQKAGDGD